jgi:hypothetical protein
VAIIAKVRNIFSFVKKKTSENIGTRMAIIREIDSNNAPKSMYYTKRFGIASQ